MDEEKCAELDRLSRSDDVKNRKKAAQNRHTPAEVLARLSNDESDVIRGWVAEHHSTPADVLWRLYEENAKLVRFRLARNTKAPAELLILLCRDEDENVRWRLIRNRALPEKAVAILATEHGSAWATEIREFAATHRLASQDTLRLLANDKCDAVRVAVATNPNTALATLASLVRDVNAEVKELTLDRLEQVSDQDLERLVAELHQFSDEDEVQLSLLPRQMLLSYLVWE